MRSDHELHTIVRINNGGGPLIYNTANQIIKNETQELRPFLIFLFICNQARKPTDATGSEPSEAYPNSGP